ncbi:MAG: M13 family metallopeptidase [Bacteroidales bacterium]|nr:M13 family metallopeptidase [Bacteroidales bacterium]
MFIDKKNLDESISPGKDFYRYANGGWMKRNPLPPEYSRYGSFDILAEENNEKLRELIEGLSKISITPGSLEQKVHDFYTSGMDTNAIEKAGINPIRRLLDEVNSIKTKAEFLSFMIRMQAENFQYLFSFYGSVDPGKSEWVMASISQGGLGLGDVDYYTRDDDQSKAILSKYREHISKILQLSGFEKDCMNYATAILAFETSLAKVSMTRQERRDPHKQYNKMDVDELIAICPALDWRKLIKSLHLDDLKEINVSQPVFFKELSNLIDTTELETLKAWMHWTLVNKNSDFLSDKFVNAAFHFYGEYLSGKKKILPRWKRVMANANHALGEAIGELYVARYFPPESKERMLDLVSNLKESLSERIEKLSWMSAETKGKALDKLEAINVKIGYPDKWRDYEGLNINSSGYFDNTRTAYYFNYLYNLNKIGKKVDKDEWGMTPQTVNAYYSPTRNEIVFPAAILQPPFFFSDGDDAINYGAIGMVIGHELTHGFDDQGRNYDSKGNLKDWWTEKDAENFRVRTKILVDQFDSLTVHEGNRANGQLTLGENIADLGGLNIAFSALRKAWKKNPPENQKEGFTPAQRFFLAYAHVWASNMTIEDMLRRTREDVHSLGQFRVNEPLRHMQEFLDAFELDEKAEMYLKPENRADIW